MAQTKNILVVEDEESIMIFLKVTLAFEHYNVLEAKDGQQAVEMAEAMLPDLILLDIGLPILDGWQVCQYLRNNPATKSIPIIVLSARAQDSDIKIGREYGVNAYIKKPCGTRELLAQISNCFKS